MVPTIPDGRPDKSTVPAESTVLADVPNVFRRSDGRPEGDDDCGVLYVVLTSASLLTWCEDGDIFLLVLWRSTRRWRRREQTNAPSGKKDITICRMWDLPHGSGA